MFILNWYVTKNFLATFAMSIVVLTFAMTGANLMRVIEYISQGVPPLIAGKFLLLAMPMALAFSIPWAALVSIVTKELLFRYTRVKGRHLQSKALEANAWHHRSDALSSIGAAVGIGGALLLGDRWTVLDPLASIVVGAMLVKVAWDLLRPSFGELTDGSLPAETEREMLDIIRSVPGVGDPHGLRTRSIGNHIAAEVHIRLDGGMPLSEAHEKASEVERRFKERFGGQSHIIVHMEPFK